MLKVEQVFGHTFEPQPQRHAARIGTLRQLHPPPAIPASAGDTRRAADIDGEELGATATLIQA